MTSPSDQLLGEQVRQGDEKAFVHLIRHYERTLVELIRYRVGSDDSVQDVLQETLVHYLERPAPRHSPRCAGLVAASGSQPLPVARARPNVFLRAGQTGLPYYEREVDMAWPWQALDGVIPKRRWAAKRRVCRRSIGVNRAPNGRC